MPHSRRASGSRTAPPEPSRKQGAEQNPAPYPGGLCRAKGCMQKHGAGGGHPGGAIPPFLCPAFRRARPDVPLPPVRAAHADVHAADAADAGTLPPTRGPCGGAEDRRDRHGIRARHADPGLAGVPACRRRRPGTRGPTAFRPAGRPDAGRAPGTPDAGMPLTRRPAAWTRVRRTQRSGCAPARTDPRTAGAAPGPLTPSRAAPRNRPRSDRSSSAGNPPSATACRTDSLGPACSRCL